MRPSHTRSVACLPASVPKSSQKQPQIAVGAALCLCYVALVSEEVFVIDSQASASRPSNPRAVKRRPAKQRAVAPRASFGPNARWKVQLELAPAEIALVYKQGLARGAEVCRQGTHEWRPLVTTPELRAALAAGRGLITLARRPVKKPASVAPPPPAVVKREPAVALTQTFAPVVMPSSAAQASPPAFGTLPPIRPLPRLGTFPPLGMKASGFARLVRHARPVELALVAGVAMLITWTVSTVTHRAQAARGAASNRERAALFAPLTSDSSLNDAPGALSAANFGPGSSIPVVSVADLPVEGLRPLRAASLASAAAPHLSGMRAELARALGNAARAAQSCGTGPVNTQIVATFAPSGVARAIHFGANAPPVAVRSCVLNAVARAHISPFEGDPVTVSKTISW
ncbi:MAG: hypothetical protein ABJB12_02875 [Pseudomonadota bacterium]